MNQLGWFRLILGSMLAPNYISEKWNRQRRIPLIAKCGIDLLILSCRGINLWISNYKSQKPKKSG